MFIHSLKMVEIDRNVSELRHIVCKYILSTLVRVLFLLCEKQNCFQNHLASRYEVNNTTIFISVINQLDAPNFCFTTSLFHVSTCFEHMCSKHVGA